MCEYISIDIDVYIYWDLNKIETKNGQIKETVPQTQLFVFVVVVCGSDAFVMVPESHSCLQSACFVFNFGTLTQSVLRMT